MLALILGRLRLLADGSLDTSPGSLLLSLLLLSRDLLSPTDLLRVAEPNRQRHHGIQHAVTTTLPTNQNAKITEGLLRLSSPPFAAAELASLRGTAQRGHENTTADSRWCPSNTRQGGHIDLASFPCSFQRNPYGVCACLDLLWLHGDGILPLLAG